MYWPLTYTIRAKHANKRFISRTFLQEHFALWLIAAWPFAPSPLSTSIGLLLLLFSFWCIYELGYVENDLVASAREANGKQPVGAHRYKPATSWWSWAWAAAAGLVGIALLSPAPLGDRPPLPDATLLARWGGWLAVLLATRVLFHIYNRLPPQHRIPGYLLLQCCKTFAITAVAAVTPLGLMLMGAHVVATTIPYATYRIAGLLHWPETPVGLIRLLTFAGCLMVSYLPGAGVGGMLDLHATVALCWCVFRARHEILRGVMRLSRWA